jgi:hypothetical protein
MRIVVILLLVLIIVSLGSALTFLLRDRDKGSDRTVKALTLRVGLSLGLFLLLMAGYATGLIQTRL